MEYELIIVGALETNCYLVYCPETLDCAVVDPGAEAEKIFPEITRLKLKPVMILNTHGHMDHTGANRDIKERFVIPLLIHTKDGPMLGASDQLELSLFLGARESPPADRFIEDREEISVGHCRLKVIYTPGHSPGSVSFLAEGFLLSGDTLFWGGVGRTDLPGGSWKELEESIRSKILTLPEELIVLPGHGPHTTIGQEKNLNPFIP